MSTQENKVCLYIFTHNKTGLKYFGKTALHFTIESLLKYGGSGKYWKNHIKKHGNDLSVKIYGIYNIDEVEEIALKFSKDNNIVKSLNENNKKVWANEKDENGLDGNPKGFRHSEETKIKISLKNKGNSTFGFKHSEETKKLLRKIKVGFKHSEETKNKMIDQRKTISEETRNKMKIAHKNRTKEEQKIISDKIKKSKEYYSHSDNTKEKISLANKGRVFEKVTCPYCGKIGGGSNMTRYHFENCKLKEIK